MLVADAIFVTPVAATIPAPLPDSTSTAHFSSRIAICKISRLTSKWAPTAQVDLATLCAEMLNGLQYVLGAHTVLKVLSMNAGRVVVITEFCNLEMYWYA